MNEYEFVKAPLPAMKKATCCGKDEILDGAVQSVFFAGAAPHTIHNCEHGIYLNVPFAVLVTVRNVAVRVNEDCAGSVSSSVERLLE